MCASEMERHYLFNVHEEGQFLDVHVKVTVCLLVKPGYDKTLRQEGEERVFFAAAEHLKLSGHRCCTHEVK